MRLHLGCGKRNFPGFVNVDIASWPHVQHVGKMQDLSFADNETADLIYCSHGFQYLDRDEAAGVLIEWRRVLRPGGILRLAVPDFEAICQLYLERRSIQEVLGPVFGKIPGPDGFLYHRTAWDFDSLKKRLLDSNFSCPRRWDWRTIDHGIFDDHSQAYFPHMDKENGRPMSLNMEATKA